MGDRVWQVPRDDFARAWNASETLDEAAERVKVLAGGPAPRWAVMVRAGQLRGEGVTLKELPLPDAKRAA
jgi:hypothetical protein